LGRRDAGQPGSGRKAVPVFCVKEHGLSNAASGTEAEQFVIPTGFPLYDLDCTRCLFRAQVKRILSPPRNRIRGASWEVLNHHLKTGQLVPPIFACFGWKTGEPTPQIIFFFPFVPATHLRKRVLSENHATPGRKMTEYERMLELPKMTVWERPET